MKHIILLIVLSIASIVSAQSYTNKVQIVSSGGAVVGSTGYSGSASVGLPFVGTVKKDGYEVKSGLYGDNKPTANPPELTIIGFYGDFDTVMIPQSFGTSFEIKNTSSTDTTLIGELAVTGSNFLLYPTTSFSLKQGESQLIGLYFKPTEAKTYNEKLIITSNASTSPDSFDVTGTGRFANMYLSASIVFPSEFMVNQENIIKVTIANDSKSERSWLPCWRSLPVLSWTDPSLFRHLNDTTHWYKDIDPGSSTEYSFGYTPRSVKDTLNVLCTFPDQNPPTDKMFNFVIHWDLANHTFTGVVNKEQMPEYHSYPNPTTGEVNLMIGEIGELISVSLYDIEGRAITKLPFILTDNTVVVSIADKPNGTYILRAEGNKSTIDYKTTLVK
jgi:hypothetical protein